MHKTLTRQLRRYIGETNSMTPQWQSLLQVINETYQHFDEDRTLMERSLDISSKELIQFNDQLKKEKENVERKVEERTLQLHEEQAKLQASINSLNVGFIMTDINNSIVTINSAAKHILFLQSSNFAISKNYLPDFKITLEDVENQLKDVIDLRSHIEKCVKDQELGINIEVPFGKFFLKIFVTPILLQKEKSEVIGTVILIEDVSEAKIIERSKDEFLSIASHELRTPLTAIQNYSELIQMKFSSTLNNTELQSMIENIREATIRLTHIVNDFLDVTRLEQGRVEVRKEKLDTLHIINEIIAELQGIAADKHLSITVEKPPYPLPYAYVDKDKLKQILVNLIGNAIKFTDKGGITLLVQYDNHMLRIFVVDTGQGIPEINQGLLFRKFQQAGNSLFARDATRGTGLGLYISKLLVNLMGGEIKLESSQLGKGTIFSFTLPVAPDSVDQIPINDGVK